MNNLYIFIVLGALQIAIGLCIIIYSEGNSLAFHVVLSGLIIANAVIFMLPIKASIDQENDCRAFYVNNPNYPSSIQPYNYTFLTKCHISNENIENLKQLGLDIQTRRANPAKWEAPTIDWSKLEVGEG